MIIFKTSEWLIKWLITFRNMKPQKNKKNWAVVMHV